MTCSTIVSPSHATLEGRLLVEFGRFSDLCSTPLVAEVGEKAALEAHGELVRDLGWDRSA